MTSIGPALQAAMIAFSAQASPAPAQTASVPPKRPAAAAYFIETVAERRSDRLPPGPLYWRIETFPSRDAATAAAGEYALAAAVAERYWLFTLGPRGGSSHGARLIAEIGPVARPVARTYLLRINRAGGPPGSRTPVHSHPGSEAIYVLRGQVSQRTSHGIERAGPDTALNAHAPEMAMQLISSGAAGLEQLVMFVVDADRPFSPPAVLPD